jgi:hypothetical protein
MRTPSESLPAIRHVSKATRDIIQHYVSGNVGVRIAERLVEENENVTSVLAELQKRDSQLSWGITRNDRKYSVIILLAEEGGPAHRVARDIEQGFGGIVSSQMVGTAHGIPKGWDPVSEHKAASLLNFGIFPGASISHHVGFPGTVGCMVRSARLGENSLGLLTASHVLSLDNMADEDDRVFVPAVQDGAGLKSEQCGVLVDYTSLPEFRNLLSGRANQFCCVDVALVRQGEKRRFPERTMVPNPSDQNEMMPIRGVLGGEQAARYINKPVFKVGRTTGFSGGTLKIVGLQRQPIWLNEKPYHYTNILAVKARKGSPFSRPGDSGALVYTKDGWGIGLVIGGTDEFSFLTPLDACLATMQATLAS